MTASIANASLRVPVVIHAGTAIDGVAAEPITNPAIVVKDGMISAVGQSDRVSVPSDAVRVDLGERTVLPGLFDVHLHLFGRRTYNPAERLMTSRELAVLRAAEDCRKLLDAGFTTVRDVGGSAALALKRAIAEGSITGPRIFAAGPVISQTGGHADTHWLPIEDAERDPDTMVVDGPDAARRAVRLAIRAGADLIKICTTGGVGSERDHPEDEHFTQDEIVALVDEAHRAGRRVAAHAQGKRGILNALRGGVDTIEHAYYLDEECVEEFRQRRAWLVPTLALLPIYRRARDDPGDLPRDMPEWRLRKQREAIRAIEKSFRLACDAELPLATGSDYIGSPLRAHGDNADEPITMVREGLDPIRAIRAATIESARAVGVEDQLGTLEPRKRADIIAIDGDPLNEIESLRRVVFVMKDGVIHRGCS